MEGIHPDLGCLESQDASAPASHAHRHGDLGRDGEQAYSASCLSFGLVRLGPKCAAGWFGTTYWGDGAYLHLLPPMDVPWRNWR